MLCHKIAKMILPVCKWYLINISHVCMVDVYKVNVQDINSLGKSLDFYRFTLASVIQGIIARRYLITLACVICNTATFVSCIYSLR